MEADNLALADRLLCAAEHRTLSDVAAEPDAPAVDLVVARLVEDDALGEAFIVLQQEHDGFVEVLLPRGEAKLLLGAAEDDGALLDERRLVDEAVGLAAGLGIFSFFSCATSRALISRQSTSSAASDLSSSAHRRRQCRCASRP